METKKTKNQETFKVMNAIANKLRKEKGLTQKEAFAEAKIIMAQEAAAAEKAKDPKAKTAQAAKPKAKAEKKTATAHKSKTAPIPMDENTPACNLTKDEFIKKLEAGSVKFTYRNRRGVTHTTKGTLDPKLITSRKNVLGTKVAKDENSVAFYDRIHGVYCTVRMEDLLQVF